MPTEVFSAPILLALIYAAGLGAAWLVVKFTPAARRELVTDGNTRQLTIDGLRGILALAVMCHHVLITRQFFQLQVWTEPASWFGIQLGQASVSLFFMITAFLFWGRLLDSGPNMRWGRFAVGRVFRLTPLYVAVVAVVVTITLVRAHGHLREGKFWFLRNVLEWLAFTIHGGPEINHEPYTSLITAGVTWTLRYEWAFYAALPLLAILFTRARSALAALCSAVGLAVLIWLMRFEPLLPERLLPFAGGIVTAYWIRSPRLRGWGATRWFGIIGIAGVISVMFGFATSFAIIPTLLVTCFFIAVACDNRLLQFFQRPTARWLGEISYGTYLLHGVGLWLFTRILLPGFIDLKQASVTGYGLIGLGVVVLLVPIATAANLWIERPGIEWGRRCVQLTKARSTVRVLETIASVVPIVRSRS